MAYQSSLIILCQNHPWRKTAVILNSITAVFIQATGIRKFMPSLKVFVQKWTDLPDWSSNSLTSRSHSNTLVVTMYISIDKIRENGFELTKKRSRRYPATTITDADYADDIAILANTPDQAETLLHSLERAAANIGLYVNAHKTEYMCYYQTGDISTLEGTPLKLVDKFTYLGSSVESTEKDIETRLAKAWTAINRLSIIWK